MKPCRRGEMYLSIELIFSELCFKVCGNWILRLYKRNNIGIRFVK